MKRIINLTILLLCLKLQAQEVLTPAPPQEIPIILRNATLHIGDGTSTRVADVLIIDGKITKIGKVTEAFKRSEDIDLTGKHLYPGIIALNTQLGLTEIEAARPTVDTREAGMLNPGLRSVIAYNTDSRVIGTVRSNGILTAQIITESGWIKGISAVMQLDAANWEDAATDTDNALCMRWPKGSDANTIQEIYDYFNESKAWQDAGNLAEPDLNKRAMQPYLQAKRRIIIEAYSKTQIMQVLAFADYFHLDIALLGAHQALDIADQIAARKIPVILNNVHRLPAVDEEHPLNPYALPAELKNKGIEVSLSTDGFWQVRNLPFMAGTAAAYNLNPEEALQLITLNPAKVLHLDHRIGSIAEGKDANIIVSEGDLLDMKSSIPIKAMIEGRWISLENKQSQLYHKYKSLEEK
jgi:imidazolonepropionase-like amidohydrolase